MPQIWKLTYLRLYWQGLKGSPLQMEDIRDRGEEKPCSGCQSLEVLLALVMH